MLATVYVAAAAASCLVATVVSVACVACQWKRDKEKKRGYLKMRREALRRAPLGGRPQFTIEDEEENTTPSE
jgi:hypothetical protein